MTQHQCHGSFTLALKVVFLSPSIFCASTVLATKSCQHSAKLASDFLDFLSPAPCWRQKVHGDKKSTSTKSRLRRQCGLDGTLRSRREKINIYIAQNKTQVITISCFITRLENVSHCHSVDSRISSARMRRQTSRALHVTEAHIVNARRDVQEVFICTARPKSH